MIAPAYVSDDELRRIGEQRTPADDRLMETMSAHVKEIIALHEASLCYWREETEPSVINYIPVRFVPKKIKSYSKPTTFKWHMSSSMLFYIASIRLSN